MADLLPSVDIEPTSEHQRTVIWLHGLGDSGHGFAPIAPELHIPEELGVKFIFPHAPKRPITINSGMEMPGWYDIKSLDFNNRADAEGVAESSRQVRAIIDAEIASGIPSNKIVLAGFSQGGVIAFDLGLTLDVPLAGIMGLSTYMANPDTFVLNPANANTPIMQAHGSFDDVVQLSAGQRARQAMEDAGLTVEWNEYPMRHNVCPEEIMAIRTWLLSVFS